MTAVAYSEVIRYVLVRLREVWPDAYVVHEDEVYTAWARTYPRVGTIRTTDQPDAIQFVCADTVQFMSDKPCQAFQLVENLHV